MKYYEPAPIALVLSVSITARLNWRVSSISRLNADSVIKQWSAALPPGTRFNTSWSLGSLQTSGRVGATVIGGTKLVAGIETEVFSLEVTAVWDWISCGLATWGSLTVGEGNISAGGGTSREGIGSEGRVFVLDFLVDVLRCFLLFGLLWCITAGSVLGTSSRCCVVFLFLLGGTWSCSICCLLLSPSGLTTRRVKWTENMGIGVTNFVAFPNIWDENWDTEFNHFVKDISHNSGKGNHMTEESWISGESISGRFTPTATVPPWWCTWMTCLTERVVTGNRSARVEPVEEYLGDTYSLFFRKWCFMWIISYFVMNSENYLRYWKFRRNLWLHLRYFFFMR